MKNWIATFTAVLAAIAVGGYFLNKSADERAANERAISEWSESAKKHVQVLQMESRTNDWRHSSYDLARMHLDRAPVGANKADLADAVKSARFERDVAISEKSKTR